MKIIAFGHRRYTGKDTCANFLVSHIRSTKRNVLVRKVGFASKGKMIAHDLYGWAGLMDEEFYEIHPELKDVVIPVLSKSPRDIWIGIMDTLRDVCFRDTWLVYPLRQIKVDYLILKDVRYPNEGDQIAKAGGLLIRVDNPRIQQFNDPADSAMKDYDNFDKIIVNDDTMAILNQRVLKAVEEYL